MQIVDGVHRLGSDFVGMYVLADGGKLTVIDAATPRSWPAFTRFLAEMGWGLVDVEAVLVTHAHPDHLGIAEELRVEAGCPVKIHPSDVAVATGRDRWRPEWRLPIWRPMVLRTLLQGAVEGVLSTPPVTEISTFADGERLDLPGRPLVIHAPGHTPGSCALLSESRGALFVGDVLATVDIATGAEGPVIPPSFANDDSEQALASLDRLDGIEADVLLPGHGKAWTGTVADALSHARRVGIR